MSDCEGPPQRPRRFLAAFSLTLAMLLGAVAFLNWQVDPFAQYGTGRFAPVVRTSRGEKLELLAAQTAPQGLVLGSSRVMKLEPT
ncbi:MAG: hypothetical protein KDA61_11390 [Planctomycetales bacterium]|nr:hypothetical protein [Planctomycetales bacterium]